MIYEVNIETSVASTGSTEDEQAIWEFLKDKGLSDFAVAGIMGNLYAESGLRSNNLQQAYERKLGYTDATYTKAVDDGSYKGFVTDAAGYGLAQWTYSGRKANLLKFATARKKSISDFRMQLEFMWEEMRNSNLLMKALASASSVKSASDAIMTRYERPADQSASAKAKRASYGQKYYDKYAVSTEPEDDQTANLFIQEWQDAAMRDGFTPPRYFAKYGADGVWGPECEEVAKVAVVMMRDTFMYPHLTRLVQRAIGMTGYAVDGKCGPRTKQAIKEYQKYHRIFPADGKAGIKVYKKILGVK